MTCLGCDVSECQCLVIFVDDIGRDGAVNDLVENCWSVGVCKADIVEKETSRIRESICWYIKM